MCNTNLVFLAETFRYHHKANILDSLGQHTDKESDFLNDQYLNYLFDPMIHSENTTPRLALCPAWQKFL